MSREVMQKVLKTLKHAQENFEDSWVDAIAVIEAELAKPEQEPEHPLHVKAERESAWQARDTRCGCDHNEYCKKCWPLEFRAGGYWDQREAQAEHNTKEKIE